MWLRGGLLCVPLKGLADEHQGGRLGVGSKDGISSFQIGFDQAGRQLQRGDEPLLSIHGAYRYPYGTIQGRGFTAHSAVGKASPD